MPYQMSESGRRSQRLAENYKRLDLKVLNDTGEKIYRSSDVVSSSSGSDTDNTFVSVCSTVLSSAGSFDSISKQGQAQTSSEVSQQTLLVDSFCLPVQIEKMVKSSLLRLSNLRADIDDHLDENEINVSINVVEDIDKCVSKIERLRTKYRKVYQEVERLKTNDEDKEKDELAVNCESVLSRIKNYILEKEQRRSTICQGEAWVRENEGNQKERMEDEIKSQKVRSVSFLLNEISRLIVELGNEFSKPKYNVSDEEYKRRSRESPESSLKIERLSKKFQQFLEIIPDYSMVLRSVTIASSKIRTCMKYMSKTKCKVEKSRNRFHSRYRI